MSRSLVRCPFVLLLALLSLTAFAGPTSSTAAPTNPLGVTATVTAGPVLTGAACTGETPRTLLVTGEEFTPGSEVEVLLYRPGIATPAVIRSLRASLSVYGRNGSTDPARGFQRGGFIGIALGPWCAETAAVRAFDRQAGAWSAPLAVDLGCDSVS
jgi:hypothetical protein